MQFWKLLSLSLLLFSVVNGVSASSQTTGLAHEEKHAFDAVSIRQIESFKRITAPGSSSYLFTAHKPCVYSEDKVLCQLSLEELIREAYGRKRYEVSGPKWFGEDVFVVQAVYAEITSQADARKMMQGTLEDRFKLKSHLENKLLKAYVLMVGPGGPHLALADPVDVQKKFVVHGGPPSSVTSSTGRFAAVAIGLDDLGPWIERSAGLDGPVLNGTGLDGRYKLELDWNPSETGSPGADQDNGILEALKKETGLILRKQNTPISVLVIDHVARTPAAN